MSYQTDCDLGWKLSWKLSRFVEFCHVLSPAWVLTSHPTNLSPLLCRWRAWRGGGWWTVTMKTGPWNPKPSARSAGKLQCRAISFCMDIPKFGAIHPFFGQHHIVKHVFFPAEAHPSISMKTLILKKWNRDCEVLFFHHVSGYWSSKSTSF